MAVESQVDQITSYYFRLNNYLNYYGTDPGSLESSFNADELNTSVLNVNSCITPKYRSLYKSLISLCLSSNGLIENIIVQGSFGDFTNVSYSDLDIVLFIPQETLSSTINRNQLKSFVHKRVWPFIFTIDPLQHHGPFWLWPQLLNHYPENILPHIVYSKSWAIKPKTLAFRFCPQLDAIKLPIFLSTIFSEYKRSLTFINAFYFKRFLSHLMMVPCIYFMDKGIYVHKSESFELFLTQHPVLKPFFTILSQIRNAWPSKPLPVNYFSNKGFGYKLIGKYSSKFCGFFYKLNWYDRHEFDLNFRIFKNYISRLV